MSTRPPPGSQAKGVITSSFAFRLWSQFNSVPGVQAGEYSFAKNSSFDAVRTILAGGPNVFPLVVPPGFTVAELADRVGQLPGHDAATFLRLATERGRPVALAAGRGDQPRGPAGGRHLHGGAR